MCCPKSSVPHRGILLLPYAKNHANVVQFASYRIIHRTRQKKSCPKTLIKICFSVSSFKSALRKNFLRKDLTVSEGSSTSHAASQEFACEGTH